MTWLVQRLTRSREVITVDEVKKQSKDLKRMTHDKKQMSQEYSTIRMNIHGYDYMGSAEFEWGSIGIAVRHLIQLKEKGDLSLEVICLDNKIKIYTIIKANQKEKDINTITKLFKPWAEAAKNQTSVYGQNLKEMLMYKNAFAQKEDESNLVGWLCVDERDPWYAFYDYNAFRKIAYLIGFTWPEVHSFEIKVKASYS